MNQYSPFLLFILSNQSNHSKLACIKQVIKLVEELQIVINDDKLFETHKKLVSVFYSNDLIDADQWGVS